MSPRKVERPTFPPELLAEIEHLMPRLGSLGRYRDRDGNPISIGEWGLLFQLREYAVVDQTEVPGGLVSTVWLGGPIVPFLGSRVFETALLGDDGTDILDRYDSEAEAIEGHDKHVAALRRERGH